MNLQPATTEEHKEIINKAVHNALHEATRNQVGLALMANAYSFACFASPESDFETQVCLAMQLVSDALKDVEQEPESMSFLQAFKEGHADGPITAQ